MGISAINVKKRYLCVCVLVVRCIYIAGVNLQEVVFKVSIALKVFFTVLNILLVQTETVLKTLS